MSQAKSQNCGCHGVLSQWLTIPLTNASGYFGPARLLISPWCNDAETFVMPAGDGDLSDGPGDTDDGDDVGVKWTTTTSGSFIPNTGDPARPFKVVTTVNSLSPGGVVTEFRYTDVDGLLLKYESMTPYTPHRGMTMVRADYDTTATLLRGRSKPFVCLRPATEIPGEVCDCGDGTPSRIVGTFSLPSYGYVDPHGGDGGGTGECGCRAFEGTYVCPNVGVNLDGGGFPDCGGVKTLKYHCEGVGDFFPAAGWIMKANDADSTLLGIFIFGPPTNIIWQKIVDKPICEVLRDGGTFTLEELEAVDPDEPHCDRPTSVTLTLTPVDANGEPTTNHMGPCSGTGGSDNKICEGATSWYLKKRASGDLWQFYWNEVSTSRACSGRCDGRLCASIPPYPVDSAPISEEVATAAGLWDRVNVLDSSGTCGCGGSCEGTSDWILLVDTCPDLPLTPYLLKWGQAGDTCSGRCFTNGCNPTPPTTPAIPTHPISSEDYAAWSGMVGQTFAGGCGCAERYVVPECPPPCATCDDNIQDKVFTLSGISDLGGIYNGTYVLIKDIGECSWTGINDSVTPQAAQITYDGTTYTLEILPGVAIYTFTSASPCVTSMSMSKISAPSPDWPASISVTI